MRTLLTHLWQHALRHPHARPLFPTWQAVVEFALVIAGLAWGSHWLSERGVFRLTEAQVQAALDIAQHARPAPLVEEIVVVRITKEDLTRHFGDQITAENLFPVLTMLDALKARTVVVDIDTSGPGFRNMEVPPLPHARVVWAHGVAEAAWNKPQGRRQYVLYPILGGGREMKMVWSGVAVLEGSGDGMVDQYPRCVETTKAVSVPTLHWAAVAAYRGEEASTLCADAGSTRPASGHADVTRINQLHNRYTFKQVPLAVVPHARGEDTVVRDRLVVLGGEFSRADQHRTPLGPKWGWQLQAAAMAATLEELQHGGHTVPAWWPLLVIELVLGLAIRWMHHKLRRWVAFCGTLGVLSVVVLYTAVLAAQWSGFRMALVPFLIGIWFHQLVEGGE